MEYKRDRRACLNLIRDQVDNYIEHKNDEIEEILEELREEYHKCEVKE